MIKLWSLFFPLNAFSASFQILNSLLFIYFLLAAVFKAKRQKRQMPLLGSFAEIQEGGRVEGLTPKYQMHDNSITTSTERQEKGETLPGVASFSLLFAPHTSSSSSLLSEPDKNLWPGSEDVIIKPGFEGSHRVSNQLFDAPA